MNIKKQIYYIIKEYKKGAYSASDFCNLFVELFGIKLNKTLLTDIEKKEFETFFRYASRYSEFEEEFEMYPNVYFNKSQIDNALNEMCKKLDIK